MKKFPLLTAMMLAGSSVLAANNYTPPGEEIIEDLKFSTYVPTKAHHIWEKKTNALGVRFLRYKLNVKEKPVKAWLYINFDDSGHISVNGKTPRAVPLDRPPLTINLTKYEFQELLTPGENVIACQVNNAGGPGGPILRGEIVYQDGSKQLLVSGIDGSWKISPTSEKNWSLPGFDDSAWENVYSAGDAKADPWHRDTDIYSVMATDEELAATEANFRSKIKLPDGLAKEKQSKARIVWKGDFSSLQINNKYHAPLFFVYLNNIWKPNSSDAILKSYRSGVRLFWEMVIPERYPCQDGKYDYSRLSRDMERLLTLCPEANIALNLRIGNMNEWMKNHPDDVIQYASGDDYSGDPMHRYKAPSYASEAFRAEWVRIIRDFNEYIKSQPWGKRVVVMRISNGVYGEWHYFGTDSAAPDTSPAMQKYFRKYLQKKYKTDEALAAAWQMPGMTLEKATVPGMDIRTGKNYFLRNHGSADQWAIDYFHCQQQCMTELLIMGCQAAKSVNPHLLTGSYYGYIFCLSYPQTGQVNMLEKVLESPYVDFLCGPYGYTPPTRMPYGDGLLRSLPLLFRKYNKIFISEMDVRTYRDTGTFYRCKNEDETVAVLQRDFANVWLGGGGAQLLDLAVNDVKPSWFNGPQIQLTIHRAINIWNYLYKRGNRNNNNDIAVVWHTPEFYIHGHRDQDDNYPLQNAISDLSLHALRRSGCSFDLITPEMYMASGSKYKTVVFLNLFTPTPEQKNKIMEMTRRKGITAVYVYACGAATPQGLSDAAAGKFSGIDLKFDYNQNSFQVKYDNGKVTPPLYEKRKDAPTMIVTDKQAQVVARYLDNNQPAEAVKKLPGNSTAIFAGAPILDPARWNEIFKAAGHHVYTPAGVVMQRAGRLMMVLTDKAGEITVTMPKRVRQVKDLFSGKIVARNTDKFVLRSDKIYSWALEVED